MNYDDFVGEVQHRARLPSSEDAVKAIRSTLETLGRRLHGGEAGDLAAQLPEEIARYLPDDGSEAESFGLQEFLVRVSEAEGVGLPESVHHARAVISVLLDAVSQGEIDHVRDQLPEDWQPIFEAGSEDRMSPGQS